MAKSKKPAPASTQKKTSQYEALANWSIANRQKIAAHQAEFRRLFGRNLRDFCSPPTFDFDVIKFDDEVVKPPDGKSTRDMLLETQEWGQPAVDLIAALIGNTRQANGHT